MSEVPATATPLTRAGIAAAFLPAYVDVFGEEPDRERAEMLTALVCLENANGSAIIDFNWGNLSTFATSPGDYWRPPWFDLDKVNAMPDDPTPATGFGAGSSSGKKQRYLDLHQKMLDGKAPSAFRAFGSQEEGARAWLQLLKQPNMKPVLDAASSGDSTAFAHAIFSSGYCRDQECRDAGPSYGSIRDAINKAGLFASLKKKVLAPAAEQRLGLWFWAWGRLLSLRTSGRVGASTVELRGEL